MAGTNDFVAFADSGGANVISQADYIALTTLIANGFLTGVANSAQINKVFRQGTIASYLIGQLIVNQLGVDAADNGDTATLLTNFQNAISALAGLPKADGTGTGDAIVADFTPNITFAEGVTVIVRAPAAANVTTTPQFTPDAVPSKTIVKGNNLPLAGGDIAGAGHWLILTADTALNAWVLANPATGINTSGATGGGGDKMFWNNAQTVNNSYTVPASTNSMIIGPTVTVSNGATITVTTGSSLTIIN